MSPWTDGPSGGDDPSAPRPIQHAFVESMRTLTIPLSWRTMLVLGIAGAIACLALPSVADPLSMLVAGASIGILAVAGIRSPHHAWPWLVLAAGLAVYGAGDLASMGFVIGPPGPERPAIAELLYLGGQTTTVVALLWLAAPRERGWYRPALLDGALLASALGLVFLTVAMDAATTRGGDLEGLVLAWAYPTIDLSLAVLIGGRLYARRARPAAVLLILAGAIGWLASDIGFALAGPVAEGWRPGDVGWLLGYICFAAAALHPSSVALGEPADEDDDLTNGRLVFVAICITIGIAALLVHDPLDPGGRAAENLLAVVFAFSGGARLIGALVRARDLLQTGHQLREELNLRARSDPLTKLPNRLVMERRLDVALAAGAGTALLCMDLDDFKVVNDAWGHHTGDALLLGVAERIRGVTRSFDDIARLGGDEFTVVVSPCAEPLVAERVAERIRGAFDEPIIIDGHSIRVRPSIGIAWTPGADASGTVLLQQADLAMYDAKARGGNQSRHYAPSMRDHAVERASLRADLEDALGRDEIGLVYQPIVRIADEAVVAVEALARWDHPVHGPVPPATFVRIAEAAGITDRLTRNVLLKASRQLAAWDAEGAMAIGMHVNLSPLDITNRDIAATVARAIAESGIAPSRLVLELTETSLVDAERVGPVLRALKELGTGLALDDFGSRYAVIANLAELPFDMVKIDRSITVQLSTEQGRRLVSGVIRLAQSLGVAALAEGVEDGALVADLRAMGCSFAQGYALGRPMDEPAIRLLLLGSPATRGLPAVVGRLATATS